LGFSQYTRGTGAFCVCQGVHEQDAYSVQFDPFLPSVLCKETPTLSPQHTHISLCDKDLCVCRFFEFARSLGGAIYMFVRTFEAGSLNDAADRRHPSELRHDRNRRQCDPIALT